MKMGQQEGMWDAKERILSRGILTVKRGGKARNTPRAMAGGSCVYRTAAVFALP